MKLTDLRPGMAFMLELNATHHVIYDVIVSVVHSDRIDVSMLRTFNGSAKILVIDGHPHDQLYAHSEWKCLEL